MDIIRVAPEFKETIWGGSKLRTEFGYNIPGDKTGECWAVAAHPDGDCQVVSGEYSGMKLSELWNTHRELFGGMEGDRFPILTKLIDAEDELSIQVHPDDEYAAKNENGSLGKMECWYILDCDENANIVIGHNAKSKDELRSMIEEGRWSDLIREIPIKKGDFLQINPGTVHAIKAGTLLLETQQNSDITYRLYDHDRLQNGKPRELHIKQSLDVINIPYVPEIVSANKGDVWRSELYSCKYYTVWKASLDGLEVLKQDRCFIIGSVISGAPVINGTEYHKGDHFIIPSGMREVTFEGKAELIFSAP